MPYRKIAAAILRDWREVEQTLHAVVPGSPESERLRNELERLRLEYRELVAEQIRHYESSRSGQADDPGDRIAKLPEMDRHFEILLTNAVKNGGRVMFSASEGACSVCRMLHGRVFDPKIAPVIPVKGCENRVCRCDYLPVSN